MSDDDFYKTMKAKPLLDRLEWAAFKMCQRGHHEDFASDTMTEAKARIETLEAAFSELMKAWEFWQSQETKNGFSELCAAYWDAKATLFREKKE